MYYLYPSVDRLPDSPTFKDVVIDSIPTLMSLGILGEDWTVYFREEYDEDLLKVLVDVQTLRKEIKDLNKSVDDGYKEMSSPMMVLD